MALHKMVNLRRSPKERADGEAGIVEFEEPEFPYGTRIELEDDNLRETGVDVAVGTSVTIRAKAEVVSRMKREGDGDDEEHISMSLQITDIEIIPETESRDAADVFYS